MRYLISFLLLGSIIGILSCGNGSQTVSDIAVTPAGDSTTMKSYFQITFNNSGSDSEYFYMNDLAINGSPVCTINSTILEATDTSYTYKLVVDDFTTTRVNLNLLAFLDAFTTTGTYTVTTSGSTLTDFSKGQNRVYSVLPGSTVNVVGATGTTSYGTFNLNLYYNYQITAATGSFKVY